MTYTSKLAKGLLGATALTLLSTGTAFAQNAFTPADTTVSNSFTLDYSVGGVPQTQIETNDDPADPGDDNDPTTFKVDRLVNVTVDSAGTTSVAPGETNAVLTYNVTNNGNDTHAYFLGIEEVANGTGDDDFDSDAPTSTVLIEYQIGGAGAFVTYDPSSPPVLAPDEVMIVRVQQDIPAGANDTEQADVILFADTRDNIATFPATVGDNNTTNDPDATENVLADEDGPGNATNDGVTDGAHSALSSYIVTAADIAADKTVLVISQDASACTLYPGGAYTPVAADTSLYSVPGACVEYTIEVENDGEANATDIILSDFLPTELLFVDAKVNAPLTGTLAEPTPSVTGTPCPTATSCEIRLTAGTLPGTTAAPTGTKTGSVTIRAIIQ